MEPKWQKDVQGRRCKCHALEIATTRNKDSFETMASIVAPVTTEAVCIMITAHSVIQTISIASLQVHYYSEALRTQHGYCIGVSRRSATGNCELRTCLRSLCGG